MQTVYQTQTAKAKVCFVVVPPYLPDTLHMDYSPLSDRWLLCYATLYEDPEDDFKNEINNEVEKLPEGDWQLIGPLSEVREEQAARIVASSTHIGRILYRGYEHRHQLCMTAKSAINSLARSLGIPEGQNIVLLAEFIS